MRRLTLIATGGTIAMVGGRGGGARFALSAAELLDRAPAARRLAEIEVVDLSGLSSASFGWREIRAVAETVDRCVGAGADGIVITHGTDTLEETAFALACGPPREVPVVLTGAMRRFDEAGPDGAANLEAAVRVALAPEARDKGVLVAMDDEIHAAAFVRKVHAFRTHAFSSAPFGPLGWVKEGHPWFAFAPEVRLPGLAFGSCAPRVPLLEAGSGFESDWLPRLGAVSDGLVLSLPGGGHIHAAAAPAVEAIARLRPVVFATRTGSGGVLERSYGFAGSEQDLIARGAIPATWLDPRKARVLLALLLSRSAPLEAVRAAFAALG